MCEVVTGAGVGAGHVCGAKCLSCHDYELFRVNTKVYETRTMDRKIGMLVLRFCLPFGVCMILTPNSGLLNSLFFIKINEAFVLFFM